MEVEYKDPNCGQCYCMGWRPELNIKKKAGWALASVSVPEDYGAV